MDDMKACKSLEAYYQLTSGWISDVAVFVEKVGRLCEERVGGFVEPGGVIYILVTSRDFLSPILKSSAPASSMSADLQWMITRNTSCFLVKRNKQFFSREPNNLYNRHGKKACGLVNKQAIGIEACTDDKGVVLVTKNKANQRKPAKSSTRIILKQGNRCTLNTIRKVIRTNKCRKDQKMAALRRASAILSSQRPLAARRSRGKKQ
ncbi:60S ribosomal protein L28 [Lamellibrachia satsuma]|nr:60S ribosomal protein L28 [Lamellibrachia satsuma]